jgi:Family of unknown function (DUF5996)
LNVVTATEDLNRGWPALPIDSWEQSRDTLHMWTQIVGKTRLALSPPLNHSWGVTLYPTATGLTTSLMPYGARGLEVSFDFVRHTLTLQLSSGECRQMALQPRSVADFFSEYRARLDELGVEVPLNPMPVELPDVIPFDRDTEHASYDPVAVNHFWESLVCATRVLERFRAEFRGKASPVHFFWGAFDLAVTRFSGRPAPEHPGGIPNCPNDVMREAYSGEVSSCGYWPGGAEEGIFYSYAYPEPAGFRGASVSTGQAVYDERLCEFVLPYSAVRTAPDPDQVLLDFLRETFEVARDLGSWPEIGV